MFSRQFNTSLKRYLPPGVYQIRLKKARIGDSNEVNKYLTVNEKGTFIVAKKEEASPGQFRLEYEGGRIIRLSTLEGKYLCEGGSYRLHRRIKYMRFKSHFKGDAIKFYIKSRKSDNDGQIITLGYVKYDFTNVQVMGNCIVLERYKVRYFENFLSCVLEFQPVGEYSHIYNLSLIYLIS